jgi:hypothetical protein
MEHKEIPPIMMLRWCEHWLRYCLERGDLESADVHLATARMVMDVDDIQHYVIVERMRERIETYLQADNGQKGCY